MNSWFVTCCNDGFSALFYKSRVCRSGDKCRIGFTYSRKMLKCEYRKGGAEEWRKRAWTVYRRSAEGKTDDRGRARVAAACDGQGGERGAEHRK